MAEQLTKRTGPSTSGTFNPIWAWYKPGAKRGPSPRLRSESSVWSAEKIVRLEIEIPDSDVLLSNYYFWENITFGFQLAQSGQEMGELVKELNSAGFAIPCSDARCAEQHDTSDFRQSNGVAFLSLCPHSSTTLRHPELGPSIRRRWEFIFDPNFLNYKMESWGWLQAALWEIRLDQVVQVKHFSREQLNRKEAKEALNAAASDTRLQK